jgi:hypothetical protein
MSSRVGPAAMNLRPCRPSVFQSQQGSAAARLQRVRRRLNLRFDQSVEFLEGRVCDTQGYAEKNSTDDRPEQHHRRDDADHGGDPFWQEAVDPSRYEAEGHLKESPKRQQDCENRQRY